MSKKPREKSARRFSLSKIRSRFSLSIQLLFLTFIVSAIGWGIIDYIQTRSLEKIFRDRLAATLSEQAQKDRAQFDNHVKKHMQAVRIYATTEFFEHYTGIDTFSEEPPTATKYFHGELPPWLPTAGIMRSLIYPRYAILIDGQGRAREVYIGWHEDPPSVLLNPSYYLQQLSHNQSYLVSLEGKPFLVTASDTHFKNGEVRATLMIAEPLDNEFLTGAEGFESKEIVALLSGRDAVVTASNRPDLLAPGTPLEAIEKDYMVTGSSFFDYGSSELLLQLTSFISYRDYEALYTSIMGTERRLRSYMALMLTTFFIILMLGIVYRIKMLGRDVRELSQWELGIDLESDIKGDELFVLERLFYRLREEINRHRSMVSSKLEELEESNEFLNMEVQHRKLTEEMLQDYMETLEQKVEDRTRELAYKASEAEMANRAKSDFLANVSHELRTPMNSIMVMSHLLEGTPLSEKQAGYFREIRQASQNLLDIIANILNFSNIEKGEHSVVIAEFNMKNLLEKVVEWAGIKATKKGLVIDFECEAAIPDVLLGDEKGLEQVLRQLLDNAVKFTEVGGVILAVRQSQVKGRRTTLRFSVKDTGIGLNSENINNLFQSFSQIDGSSTRKYGGIGLGLAICKRLVQLMGGEMGVQSEPGAGSEFYFTITAEYAEGANESAREPREGESQGAEGQQAEKEKRVVDMDNLRAGLRKINSLLEINDTESVTLFMGIKADLHDRFPEQAKKMEEHLDLFAFEDAGKVVRELLAGIADG